MNFVVRDWSKFRTLPLSIQLTVLLVIVLAMIFGLLLGTYVWG